MRTIKNIKDVVDWGLCVGCGICFANCSNQAVELINIESVGIRPIIDQKKCSECINNCLSVCPGYNVEVKTDTFSRADKAEIEIGKTLEIWEGYAVDKEIRFKGSSGGVLSAISLYCLENENMNFVLHTGMDLEKPWLNKTYKSFNRKEILEIAGSRYAPSSPCVELENIEESTEKYVFVGKPCDIAGVNMLRKKRKILDENLGLVLSFCCAGTPSTKATLDLVKSLNISCEKINLLKYRGEGWPGEFQITSNNYEKKDTLSYSESWGKLNKYRPFRCQLCPDGLGRNADISCGDAWHRYLQENNPGMSIVLVRTPRGQEILHRAMQAGYIELNSISHKDVLIAQKNLLVKRRWLWGRLFAMKILFIPTPQIRGFFLFESWIKLPFFEKIKTILGTLKRIFLRGLWQRSNDVTNINITFKGIKVV